MNKLIFPLSGRAGQFVSTFWRFCLVTAGLALLPACQTAGGGGVSNFDIFSTPQKFVVGEDVVLPRSSAALSKNTGVASTLRLAVELDQQKRFAEARHLLSQVRSVQSTDSDGYQSLTNSMAVIALKEGEFQEFKRLARQLDVSLKRPVMVKAPHTEVVTLYRAVTGKALPVNAPARMKSLKDRYPRIQNAKLKRK